MTSRTIIESSFGEYEEKRSRFISKLIRVESVDEVMSEIAAIKKEHYNARHICYAFVLEDGTKRYSDDGEPQGTAGLPILEVIEKNRVSNTLAVVSRYFGGVLLGASGLNRAYTKAVAAAFANATFYNVVNCISFSVDCDYADLSNLKRLLERYDAVISDIMYTDKTVVSVNVRDDIFVSLQNAITQQFCGRLSIIIRGSTKCYLPLNKDYLR